MEGTEILPSDFGLGAAAVGVGGELSIDQPGAANRLQLAPIGKFIAGKSVE